MAAVRLILAASALLVLVLDLFQPDSQVQLIYLVLSLYTIYSALFYVLSLRKGFLPAILSSGAYWVDIAWYFLLISLGVGTNSIFFFGFFFAILAASLQQGFSAGFRVTIVSVLLFVIFGLVTAGQDEAIELRVLLLRSMYLLVLGCLIAYLGGAEASSKRRLTILNAVTNLSNPRFGMGPTAGALLNQLRSYFGVETCLLVFYDSARDEYDLYRSGSDPAQAQRSEVIPQELADLLLAPLSAQGMLYYRRGGSDRLLWRAHNECCTLNMASGELVDEGSNVCEVPAATIGANSFISVPLQLGGEQRMRLYIASERRRFRQADLQLLVQIADHVLPIIRNITLVDRLASSAAEDERYRIARDLHDSVIQPYIGLQIGLTALHRSLPVDNSALQSSVDTLIQLTQDGINDLRIYVAQLRRSGTTGAGLLPAVERFVTRFSDATGIQVEVEAAQNVQVPDRLAGELFQMVAEGLSNVRRHTEAGHATVRLNGRGRNVMLTIENEGGDPAKPFVPGSIYERSAALGGRAHVEFPAGTRTAVIVEIPL